MPYAQLADIFMYIFSIFSSREIKTRTAVNLKLAAYSQLLI